MTNADMGTTYFLFALIVFFFLVFAWAMDHDDWEE
jgi:hypothetical protein